MDFEHPRRDTCFEKGTLLLISVHNGANPFFINRITLQEQTTNLPSLHLFLPRLTQSLVVATSA
jgi:hypothetical protein